MGLWGSTTSKDNRPKFLPEDDNASGSTGARQHAIATGGGWALSPGLAASGNDNKDAQPEVLVCIRNLAAVAGSDKFGRSKTASRCSVGLPVTAINSLHTE